jgi:hypothetical protein
LNIFFVDTDPVVAAQCLVDKHVVKMILESAQLMSTAHRVLDGREVLGESATGRRVKRFVLEDAREDILYKSTHLNHPSSKWTRTSVENYLWLVEHFFALCDEYTHRYGKTHKCFAMGYHLQSPPHSLKEYDMTPVPSAMKDEFKISEDPVINYRNYYREGKKALHRWTNREPPEWIYV